MASYETVKNSVQNNGEVMIRLSSGEELELHKHNTKFDDNTKEIIVDAVPKHIGLLPIILLIIGYIKKE